jgi:hypothetical protein
MFRPKNPMALAERKPANLGTKGQHATSRPPKLLPAGHSQGGILGAPPPPPLKLSICEHFYIVYCGTGSEFCKDNMSPYIKTKSGRNWRTLQEVNIFSSQMDDTVNICHLLHEGTVFTLVQSCYTVHTVKYIF